MGVATGCGCKEVYRFPHTTYLVSVLFCSSIPTFCSFLTFFNIYTRTHTHNTTQIRTLLEMRPLLLNTGVSYNNNNNNNYDSHTNHEDLLPPHCYIYIALLKDPIHNTD